MADLDKARDELLRGVAMLVMDLHSEHYGSEQARRHKDTMLAARRVLEAAHKEKPYEGPYGVMPQTR